MIEILENLAFDQISFWTGFVAGALGLWLARKIIPGLPGLIRSVRSRTNRTRSGIIPNNTERLRQETLRYVQGIHLASALFALDEILVEPRILAPPHPILSAEEAPRVDVLSQMIPYLPDWPELAARYSSHSFTLAETLSDGANLILLGGVGSGKSVALAHLICQIVRREEAIGDLSLLTPLYVHVSELLPDGQFNRTPLEHATEAIQAYAERISINRLTSLLQQVLKSGSGLMLIDGLDELSLEYHQEVIKFLNSIFAEFPQVRVVVTCSPENFSGLVELGLVPIAISGWNQKQYLMFIRKWSRSWFKYIRPTIQDEIDQIDPRLLNAWLLAENPVITPFDATMKAWTVFAGDTIGPGNIDAIESYIWRLTYHLENSSPGLEDFALQMVAAQEISLDLKSSRSWQTEFETDEADLESIDKDEQKSRRKLAKKSSRKLPGYLPDLIENGLLVERSEGRLAFSHPFIMAYLASSALADAPISHFLSNQPDWIGKSMTMLFLANSRDLSPEISDLLSKDDDPLLRMPLMVGRWLRYAPQNASWRSQVMRYFAAEFQRENIALGLRARLLLALLLSGDPGVGVLLRQISHTSIDDLRYVSALGMGYSLDPQSLSRLGDLLTEPEPNIFQAACFALVKIGNKQAFEILGSALLEGSDDLRRAVAEALAQDPAEGYEILKEASQMDELLVRRSSVYGLAHIDQPWAVEILRQLSLEDKEWVVRSAATQVIEDKESPDSRIPSASKPLHEIPWLISFASERGIGIAPGVPAENLLLSALREGAEEQQQAALMSLQQYPNQEAVPQIYEFLEEGFGDLQQAAFNTLWYYASEGINITPVMQHI
jgi:HEAT repeat protein